MCWRGNRAPPVRANRKPHGFGVMAFRNGNREIARYAGAFVDGEREGHGAATSDDGLV